ncbi:MAG TPA: catalase family peroxidase [Actinomycetota bacterium]|nr:catalase family peroxidase [Actinomycetota bacterium]
MKTDLAARLVDALNDIHGVHAGRRAVHAKGVCCTATFTATPEAARLTTAAHMQGAPVSATVRFSNGSGSPTRHDGARDGRGIATKYHLSDGATTDIVALTLPVFFVRTPEDFLEFTRAQKPDPETGKPDLARVEAFVNAHPESHTAVAHAMFVQPPACYSKCRYFGIHAFKWIDAVGNERFVRYRWEPEAGEATITEDESRAQDRHYLRTELARCLNEGPVAFTLDLQLSAEGDDPTDPTLMWPDERQIVTAGRLEITGLVEDQERDCEALVFDPTRVTDGIECSDDKILHARPLAYSVSHERRTSTGKGRLSSSRGGESKR